MELDLKQLVGNILLIILILLLAARVVSFAGEVQPTPFSVIESDSMEPTFSVGDLLFWRPESIDNIEEGDIVVYSSQTLDEELVVHRVVEVEEEGEKRLITQGDANNRTDQAAGEPAVTEDNLLGTPVSIGGVSFSIPRLGYIWMFLSAVITGAMAEGLAGGGTAMLIPLLTAGLMVILTIIFISPDEEDEDEKIKRLILEEEKSHIWQIFLIIFIVFSLIIVPSTWYGQDSVSISVGVGEAADGGADHQIDRIEAQDGITEGNQTVENPGHISLTHHVKVRGDRPEWISVNESNFRTDAGGNHTVDFRIEVPEDAENGTYEMEIIDYHSPFWIIYPQDSVGSMIEGSPFHGVLLLNLLTTLIFTTVTLVAMLFISFLIDKYTHWREFQKVKKKIEGKEGQSFWRKISIRKNKLKMVILGVFDWLRGVDLIDFDPEKPFYASLVGLIAVPLYFLGADLWTIFFIVPLSSLLAYHLGCRWRAEIFTAGLLSSGIVFAVLFFVPISFHYFSELTVTNLTMLLQSAAVVLIIYLIMLPIILILSYLTVYLVHRYKVKESPERAELSDI